MKFSKHFGIHPLLDANGRDSYQDRPVIMLPNDLDLSVKTPGEDMLRNV